MNSNTPETAVDAKAKIISIFGGTQLTVTFEDQTTASIRIRQLRMAEYEKAMPLIADEIALTAFCCSLDATPESPCSKNWAMNLHPTSYETVQAKVREVNQEGFFIYASRKQEQENKLNAQWMRLAADLPPEVLENVTKLGMSASRTLSPRPR